MANIENILIAEKVLGWRRVPFESVNVVDCINPPADGFCWQLPNGRVVTDTPDFGGDFTQAFEALNTFEVFTLKKTACHLNRSGQYGGETSPPPTWICRIGAHGSGVGTTPAEAIKIALLDMRKNPPTA